MSAGDHERFRLSYDADKPLVGFDNRTTTSILWGDAEQLTRESGDMTANEQVRSGHGFSLFGITYTPTQRNYAA